MVADLKLINVSSCTVETYIPIASASQPAAMMYLAGYFPASMPTMGISASTTAPPPDRTSPAFSAVYPKTVWRNCGIVTRAPNSRTPKINIMRLAVAKLKFLNRCTSMMGGLMTPLPNNETNQTNHRNDHKAGDKRGAEPIIFLSLIEHHLKRSHAQSKQRDTNIVDADACPLRSL